MRTLLIIAFLTPWLAAADVVTWKTDYPTGRREASDAGKAVCLVIGSDNCFYCRKLETNTLVDPAIASLLKKDYISIKIDGHKEAELARALKVTLFPTTVLAGPDGSIHAILNGYVTADQLREQLQKTVFAIADDDRMQKEYAQAKAAFDAGEFARASALLRPLLAGSKSRPAQVQAKELMEKLDRVAATREVVQAVRPQALLDVAKQLHDAHRYVNALDVANEVIRLHPTSAEAKSAALLVEEIRTNPDKLRSASHQADERAASLQLALSESFMKKGDTIAAKAYLDQVLRLCPSGPHAEAALVGLAKLKGPLIATPATLKK